MEQVEPFGEGFVLALAPEFVLVIGLFTLMIVPNMGNAKFRIPLTQIRIPWFFGGKRGKLTATHAFQDCLQRSSSPSPSALRRRPLSTGWSRRRLSLQVVHPCCRSMSSAACLN